MSPWRMLWIQIRGTPPLRGPRRFVFGRGLDRPSWSITRVGRLLRRPPPPGSQGGDDELFALWRLRLTVVNRPCMGVSRRALPWRAWRTSWSCLTLGVAATRAPLPIRLERADAGSCWRAITTGIWPPRGLLRRPPTLSTSLTTRWRVADVANVIGGCLRAAPGCLRPPRPAVRLLLRALRPLLPPLWWVRCGVLTPTLLSLRSSWMGRLGLLVAAWVGRMGGTAPRVSARDRIFAPRAPHGAPLVTITRPVLMLL